jgi:hypothetical protein
MPGFKPMVKMMTTEPSVELKLKKGGKVEKKMQQGGPAMTPCLHKILFLCQPVKG